MRRVLCRLRVLQLNGGRMGTQSALPESTRSSTDIGALTSMLGLPGLGPARPAPDPEAPTDGKVTSEPADVWVGQRSGRAHASLATVRRAGASKTGVAAAADFVGAQASIFGQGPLGVHAQLDQVHLLAELLFALRPLLYGTQLPNRGAASTTLLSRERAILTGRSDRCGLRLPLGVAGPVLAILRFGPRSWKAWLVGVTIELASRILARQPGAAGAAPLTEVRMHVTVVARWPAGPLPARQGARSDTRPASGTGRPFGEPSPGMARRLQSVAGAHVPGLYQVRVERIRIPTGGCRVHLKKLMMNLRGDVGPHPTDWGGTATRPLLTEAVDTLQRLPLISIAAGAFRSWASLGPSLVHG